MSKILEARRKSMPFQAGKADFDFQLETLGGAPLFPAPPPVQGPEFDQLANALVARHDGATGQTVVFASTMKDEGTSYVSFNVARHLSYILDRKVAWIDGNFRSPQPKLQGLAGPSFRDLLQAPALFPELRLAGNLVIVPNGDRPIKTTDLLSSDNYGALLDHFQRSFYFTIIDAPPIFDSIDVAHLAGPTMGLVLVVESRRLKHEVVRHGLATLEAQRIRVLGTVLNKRQFDIPEFLYRKL